VVDGIRVRGVSKRYGQVCALSDVDLEVGRGEIVALLGENGAGKSTLIRILATTVLPDSGSATLVGNDVITEPAMARAALGLMLGNERSWYWRLSGRRNLEFFAALYGLRRRAARPRAAELLALVGLDDSADRPVSDYSSGMRARLSFARALLREPPVVLLDEPSQSLDPVAAARFRDLIVSAARTRDTAVLLATHNLQEAAAVATHVVVLASGRVAHTLSGSSAADLESALLGAAPA
jgi:ABC-2 type transport system ATP-binding protein